MAWVISLSCLAALVTASIVAEQKGWLRTSKVLQFLGWFWPF
jgi:hypothetical protein